MQLFLLMWELSCCPENSFYQHFLGCQAADHGCFKQPCSLHFTSEGGTGSFADCSRCGVFAGEIEEPFPSLFPQEDSVWKNLGTLQWEQEQLLSSSISGTSDSQSGAGKIWRDLKRERSAGDSAAGHCQRVPRAPGVESQLPGWIQLCPGAGGGPSAKGVLSISIHAQSSHFLQMSQGHFLLSSKVHFLPSSLPSTSCSEVSERNKYVRVRLPHVSFRLFSWSFLGMICYAWT